MSLKTLAAVAFAASISNVKGLAKAYMPSIPAIDGMVTKETRNNFDVCMRLIDVILAKVDTAMAATADMNKSIDRFLRLINAQDKRQIGTAPAN